MQPQGASKDEDGCVLRGSLRFRGEPRVSPVLRTLSMRECEALSNLRLLMCGTVDAAADLADGIGVHHDDLSAGVDFLED